MTNSKIVSCEPHLVNSLTQHVTFSPALKPLIQFFSWIFKEETRNFAMTCSVARMKGPLTAGPGKEGG